MRETFQDAKVKTSYNTNASWPRVFYEIGQGRSVAYTSSKWQASERDFNDYKHVAESPNQFYATEELLQLTGLRPEGGGQWPAMRPTVELPPTLAELAPCLFAEVRPIYRAPVRRPSSFEGMPVRPAKLKLADHAIRIPTKQAILYGGYALRPGGSWDRRGDLVPFLTIIARGHGVLALITGKELDVERDGIVGLFVDFAEYQAEGHVAAL